MNTTEEYQESQAILSAKKLWSECFKQALVDIESSDDEYRESAVKWFKDRKNDGIGSFVWVCGLFDLNVSKTRSVVLKTI